jgi:hypothetical protein
VPTADIESHLEVRKMDEAKPTAKHLPKASCLTKIDSFAVAALGYFSSPAAA